MSPREFIMLFLMALAWGAHFSVLKVAFAGATDPIFYAAVRMTIVAIILSPLLRIHKGQMKRVMLAGVCFGGLNYALMFSGIHYTNASISAMTMELYAPIAMVFSVIFLKERIGLPRIISFIVAFIGVMIIYSAKEIDGMGSAPFLGMGLLIGAALTEAVGAITIKKIHGIKPFQLLAWFAIAGSMVLWTGTFLFESNQLEALEGEQRWTFLAALSYSILLGSLLGQSVYYWLLSRLPVNLMATSTLLVAFLGVVFGVLLLSEPLTWQFMVGGAMTLAGVGTIVIRSGRKAPRTTPEAPNISEAEDK